MLAYCIHLFWECSGLAAQSMLRKRFQEIQSHLQKKMLMKLYLGKLTEAGRAAWQVSHAVLRRELRSGQLYSPRDQEWSNNGAFANTVVWGLWHQVGESSASHNGENRNRPKSAE